MYSPSCHEVSNTMTQKNKNKRSNQVATMRKQLNKMKIQSARPSRKPTPFSDVGAHLGGFLGYKDIGRGIGGVIGRILGSGDYQTNFGAIQNNALTAPVPSFGNESTIITHREYVKDIISSNVAGAFKIDKYRLNPTNAELFPWLSTVAVNYEEYVIHGMIIEFKSMSGTSVANAQTSLGTVIVATQYDPTKSTFISKQEMENYFFSQSAPPSQSLLHAVECKEGSAPLRALYTAGGSGGDIRFTDFGNVSIASVGLPGTSVNMGEMWISYKIELRKPKISQFVGFAGASSKCYRTGASVAAYFGTTGSVRGTLGCYFDVLGNTLYIPDLNRGDSFLITIWYYGSVAAVTAAPTILATGLDVVANQWNNFSASVDSTAGSNTVLSIQFIVRCNQDSADVGTIGMTSGTLPAGTVNLDMTVTAIEYTAVG